MGLPLVAQRDDLLRMDIGTAAGFRRFLIIGLATAALLAVSAPAAPARPVRANTDGRPNILVVMTDDMATTDRKFMPNVRRLLVRQGTKFEGAVDSFPLCCPARATFITGQYAHNHGVGGNFYPYGWYGMKHRGNTLPTWLQNAGYRTALVGKWLNGYGARDAHGEVPRGFDIWRGLLDVSAYDYYNFVMNRDGKLTSWGDAEFARKLVEFANIEVTPDPGRLEGVLAKRNEVSGRRPIRTGAPTSPWTTRPTSPAESPRTWSMRSAMRASPSSSGGLPRRRTARTSRRPCWDAPAPTRARRPATRARASSPACPGPELQRA